MVLRVLQGSHLNHLSSTIRKAPVMGTDMDINTDTLTIRWTWL